MLLEDLEQVDLVRKRVDILDSFRRNSLDTVLAKEGWLVRLLVVDIHNLPSVDEFGYFLFALASGLVFALHKVIRDHRTLDRRSVTIEVDLCRVVKAEQVRP